MIIKNKSLTTWSILFVIVIFLLQLVLVYRLYQTRMDLIQRELELVIKEAYSIHLGKRIEYKKAQEQDSVAVSNKSLEDNSNILNDVKSTIYNQLTTIAPSSENSLISSINLTLEEDVSKDYPLRLQDLNALVDVLLKKYSLTLPYNIILYNPNSQEVISQTNPELLRNSKTLFSQPIPLNSDGNLELAIYANPNLSNFLGVVPIIIISLLFSVFCIYCLYYQLLSLSKQRELAESKNSFFSEVSHEMVRPLSILTQTLDSLRNENNIKDPVKRDKFITFAQVEIDKMVKKIDMVLSLAKDDEGVFELNIQSFDLVKLVYDEVDSILVRPPKQVDVDVDNQIQANPYIYADSQHMEQILSNLINNAIKYSEQYVMITIKIYRDNNNVYLSVKDTGLGISEEDQRYIFEKFSRVDQKSKQKGYGIGLNYVKRVVEKHNGDISLISTLGKGSEFIIRLPQNESNKY